MKTFFIDMAIGALALAGVLGITTNVRGGAVLVAAMFFGLMFAMIWRRP